MKALIRIFGWCVLGSALALQAADRSRAYFKFDGGLTVQDDLKIRQFPREVLAFSNANSIVTSTRNLRFDAGARFNLTAGFNVLESLAVEVEGGLIYNPVRDFTIDSLYLRPFTRFGVPTVLAASGTVEERDLEFLQVPVLANLVYTFPLRSRWKPYIGAGLGGVYSRLTSVKDHDRVGEDFTFACQGIGGFVFAVNEHIDFGITYKYLRSLDHDFDGLKTEETQSHSGMLTWKYKF